MSALYSCEAMLTGPLQGASFDSVKPVLQLMLMRKSPVSRQEIFDLLRVLHNDYDTSHHVNSILSMLEQYLIEENGVFPVATELEGK